MVRNDDLLKGVAIGIGAAILIPVVISSLLPVVKPLARSAMKTGIRVYEKGRESLEEFGETIDDIVAEVEEEMIDAREMEDSVYETVEEAEEAVSSVKTSGVS